MRQGVTEEQYRDRSFSLARARGHGGASKEKVHARELSLLRKLDRAGFRDRYGEPQITPDDLREARERFGDQWVLERLEALLRDHQAFMAGREPHEEDPTYPGKKGNAGYRSPWFMYHGGLGA